MRAGQIYRTKAARGHHHVRIEQVRHPRDGTPYAIVREVRSDGTYPTGRDRNGMLRSHPFDVYLVYGPRGELEMRPNYELAPGEEPAVAPPRARSAGRTR